MALTIPYSFTVDTPSSAPNVNADFAAVKTFVDALQTGVGIDSGAITTAKIVDGAVTSAKVAAVTGSGSFVLATSPTLVTPAIGVATGTSFNSITGLATQAEQETATSVVTAVSPGRQQFHPSAAKFWLRFYGVTPAILASYNVSSVTDSAVGIFVINYTTVFSSGNYGLSALGGFATAYSGGSHVSVNTDSAGSSANSLEVFTYAVGGTSRDLGGVWVSGFGDQ